MSIGIGHVIDLVSDDSDGEDSGSHTAASGLKSSTTLQKHHHHQQHQQQHPTQLPPRRAPATSSDVNNLSDVQYCCVWSVEVFDDGYRPEVARSLLARIARHVNPILRERGWRVKRLMESASSRFLGCCTVCVYLFSFCVIIAHVSMCFIKILFYPRDSTFPLLTTITTTTTIITTGQWSRGCGCCLNEHSIESENGAQQTLPKISFVSFRAKCDAS